MKREIVRTEVGRHLPLFSAAYSIDLKSCSRLVVISGQVSHDSEARVVGRGDFNAQCEQVYVNLQKTVEAAGGSMASIVSLRTFLTRWEDFATFHEWRKKAYPRMFPTGEYPPSTAVVVTALVDPELLLEIEALAAV